MPLMLAHLRAMRYLRFWKQAFGNAKHELYCGFLLFDLPQEGGRPTT
jgi:hypothetical protein